MIKRLFFLYFIFLAFFFSSSTFAQSCPSLTCNDSACYELLDVRLNSVANDGALMYASVFRKYASSRSTKFCTIQRSTLDDVTYNRLLDNPLSIMSKTDEECDSSFSVSNTLVSPETFNFFTAGGSYDSGYGACSVSISPGVQVCIPFQDEDGNTVCSVDLTAKSNGPDAEIYFPVNDGSLNEDTSNGFPPVDYLSELPGECTSENCVTIGDKSFLVDWEKAPDWFSYVDSNGNTQSKPQPETPDPSGPDVPGGCFGNCYPGEGGGSGDGDDGNDSGGGSGGGNDSGGGNTGGGSDGGNTGGGSGGGSRGGSSGGGSGGSSGGGSSGGGSTVPDFEFDDSGVIEAIQSSGESNQRGLDAISNDLSKAIGDQTEEQRGMFDGLGNTIKEALNGAIDNLVDSLTNSDGMPSDSEVEGMIDGEGVSDSVIEALDQGAEEQKETIYQEFEGTFESGGIIDGALQPLRDFVTSFLPRLPTSNCTPLVFGDGARALTIDCEGFNLLKAALSWLLFFFTAYQLISIPMDNRKTQ